VAFASQKLSGSILNWSIGEKESYSLVYALRCFEVYISQSSVQLRVYTDHSPLNFISKTQGVTSKAVRWSLYVGQFDLEVPYLEGKSNTVADWLSRVDLP
jgi:hypothetical protein